VPEAIPDRSNEQLRKVLRDDYAAMKEMLPSMPYLRSDPEKLDALKYAQRSGRYSKMKEDVAFRFETSRNAAGFCASAQIRHVVRIVREMNYNGS